MQHRVGGNGNSHIIGLGLTNNGNEMKMGIKRRLSF